MNNYNTTRIRLTFPNELVRYLDSLVHAQDTNMSALVTEIISNYKLQEANNDNLHQ